MSVSIPPARVERKPWMTNKEWKLGILPDSADGLPACRTRIAAKRRQAGSLSSDFWNFIGQAQLLPLQLIGTLPFIHIKSWKAQIELPPMLRTPFADKYVIRSLLIRSR
jgi:hypothetical protein